MELRRPRHLSFKRFGEHSNRLIDRDFLLGHDPHDRHLSHPAVNIRKGDDHYMLEMPLPHYSKEDIKIHIEGDMLTISGKREVDEVRDDTEYILKEHDTYQFMRSFELSDATDERNITAEFENGVLHVKLPHQEGEPFTAEAHDIPIK